MSDVVIYGLFDEREKQKIRYIGATTQPLERVLHDHIALSGDHKNKKRVNWLLTLRKNGVKPSIVLLERCSVAQHAARKRFWIEHHAATAFNVRKSGGENSWEIKRAARDRAKVTA